MIHSKKHDAKNEMKSKIFINSVYGLILQVILIPINFLLRYILLRYIGVDLIGVSGTAISLVGILCLAEGGFGSAIAFCLYKPIVENDYERINKLIAVFKRVYTYIGCFILLAGFVFLFFLRYMFNGIEMTVGVYSIFYMECINSAASYFLCYRRTLLVANMQGYLNSKVDIVCNLVFSLTGVLAVFLTHNYFLYLLIKILQTVVSNVVIHIVSQKSCPYVKRTSIDKSVFKEVLGYCKNLIAGNLAAYVYNSTDNLVISTFTKTSNVGYLSNYTMISNYLKTLSAACISGATPAIGQKMANDDIDSRRITFNRYSGICRLMALLVCVPTYVLMDSFIENVYGAEYVLDRAITIFITMVVYLFIAPFACGTYITTSGNFKILKYVEILGAVTNLMISLVMVRSWGISGVLLGTVVSAFLQWVVRSYYVYIKILQWRFRTYMLGWLKELVAVLILVISEIVISKVMASINIDIYAIEFVFSGLISVVIAFALYTILYHFEDKLKITDIVGMIRRK